MRPHTIGWTGTHAPSPEDDFSEHRGGHPMRESTALQLTAWTRRSDGRSQVVAWIEHIEASCASIPSTFERTTDELMAVCRVRRVSDADREAARRVVFERMGWPL